MLAGRNDEPAEPDLQVSCIARVGRSNYSCIQRSSVVVKLTVDERLYLAVGTSSSGSDLSVVVLRLVRRT